MFQFLRHCLCHVLILSLTLSLSLASPGYSKGEGTGGDGTRGGGGGGEAPGPGDGGGSGGLSNAVTKNVVKSIKLGVSRCQRIDKVYRFDCYRQTYKYAASLLYGRAAYAGALEALTEVEKALDAIMARDADPQKPPVRRRLQQYRAIKPAAVPKATAELERALSSAETILLRAPERTGTHYARIAEVLDSNKVLLRSRLYPDGTDSFRTGFA